MAAAFTDFFHPAAASFMPWDLDSGLLLDEVLWDTLGEVARSVVEPARSRIEGVVDSMRSARRQVIHNDAHRGNLLRKDAHSEAVVGIIDFGDLVHTVLAADLGISGASFVGDQPDPIDALGALARGFHREMPLTPTEVAMLPDLVLARLTLSTLLSEFQIRHTPHIAEAVANELPGILESLALWLAIDPAVAAERLHELIEET